MEKDYPQQQGMYDPAFEKDACGIGAIASIKGIRSHKIVTDALRVLTKLDHRGGVGADPNVGDGAGILIQLPHKFLTKKIRFSLGEEGQYAVGMFFLPHDGAERKRAMLIFENIVDVHNHTFLGWREVPINASSLGDASRDAMPYIAQAFVKRNDDSTDRQKFDVDLFAVRKEFEKLAPDSYICSLSCRTIVYKGMLTSKQLEEFYPDLNDEAMESALALVHSRFSTNTFPSWRRAHPNRLIIHNGEINTIKGNQNWMTAREGNFTSKVFGDNLSKVLPVINPDGSDSSMLDNSIEFMVMNGRTLPEAVMMHIPEPWSKNKELNRSVRDYFEYKSTMMEPWDGPAAIAFTDGEQLGAVLDRNGLRPARYYITKDDYLLLASEVGVFEVDQDNIKTKGRLKPGKMLLVDTLKGELINDKKLKDTYSRRKQYAKWIERSLVKLEQAIDEHEESTVDYSRYLKGFGYTYEDVYSIIQPMATTGDDPLSAMGVDTPLAVLSNKNKLLYDYFKQMFAQVTNPPIDAIREEIVTSVRVYLGAEGNILEDSEKNCTRIKLANPIISNLDLKNIEGLDNRGFRSVRLPLYFDKSLGKDGLEIALKELCKLADKAIAKKASILILSDKEVDETKVQIPALLATSALHHHLIKKAKRTKASIVVESAEPREVHHFALLLGFGANAINPYFVYDIIRDLVDSKTIAKPYKDAVHTYDKAILKGVVKVISKMGISTIQSYCGAQIFEALGLSSKLVERYFPGTPTRIEGLGIEDVARETIERHTRGFDSRVTDFSLDSAGSIKYRSSEEEHLYNPMSIYKLQNACRTGSYKEFKEYSALFNNEMSAVTLRNLLYFRFQEPIPIDEVESAESIVKRFKTGAMSYGSISKEAHECLAIAMNRLGGKSNTGEGGEERERFTRDENGDLRSSAIKQIASGRFGVTSEYLLNAKEIQIKMAQGAKPGEGGQLPGTKVYPWIAKARHATVGVGLISPPPHHDIYSIEDLAQLIYDMKNSNQQALINVKLVSEAGVGTVAAGVAKGGADVILISGYDGGTGASPMTSIRHAGLPWEMGLAEAHQTLVLNGLRQRVKIETDGKLMTGKDVVIAALLGAEEFGFATAPLAAIGCVMMRVCNLDTCPVGIATQNEELRKRFAGKPEYVVNFMMFIAQEMREYMAELGFRTIDEMVGRTDKLCQKPVEGWKTQKVNLTRVLFKNFKMPNSNYHFEQKYDQKLYETIDAKVLLDKASKVLESGEKVSVELDVDNVNRTIGTMLGSEITRRYQNKGLPEDTVWIKMKGAGGQSMGAFIPSGITLELWGDANDYVGKGLSGGKIIVQEEQPTSREANENIVIGNVAFYGATSGKAYINGAAGERFCVRNSGIEAVVEGVGDHGCEYMTGGRVAILGTIGRNFAAGMSGGIAYIQDETGMNRSRINTDMVYIEKLDGEDEVVLRRMLEDHYKHTRSAATKKVLDRFDLKKIQFVKVLPKDYKKIMTLIKRYEQAGYGYDEAERLAFADVTTVKK